MQPVDSLLIKTSSQNLKKLLTALFTITALSGFAQKGTVTYHEGIIMKSLDRERTIRIYLPPGYEKSDKQYPVLYMHDGQNLFADSTSFVGEWHVDETLDSLYQSDGLALIVVGIDNGGKDRIAEYTAWTHEKYGGGQGAAYAEFVVNELKPMIDSTYRTQPNHTAVIGSSLGGLISHYMIFKYPEIFNKAGIFSPSYWFSEEVEGFTSSHQLSDEHKVYTIMGSQEGKDGVAAFNKQTEKLKTTYGDQVYVEIVEGAEHNELFWSEQLAACLLWLFE